MLMALVQEVPSCWFDQYQTLIAVPTTMSSGPSPFTSPAPSALIGPAVELAELHPCVEAAPGNELQITVPVAPNPVKLRTAVPNATATSDAEDLRQQFPIVTPTDVEPALEDAA